MKSSDEKSGSYAEAEDNHYVQEIQSTMILNKHEEYLQREKHRYQLSSKNIDNKKEIDILKSKLGLIGGLFGCADNAARNITAFVCLLLIFGVSVISIIVYFYDRDINFVKIMWTSLLPVITLSLGYLFGKK